jgi:choloylglycine hydrolase
MRYLFESTQNPNVIWLDLDKLDFTQNAEVKPLSLEKSPNLVGNVSDCFVSNPYINFWR